jgi:hypothetical protein
VAVRGGVVVRMSSVIVPAARSSVAAFGVPRAVRGRWLVRFPNVGHVVAPFPVRTFDANGSIKSQSLPADYIPFIFTGSKELV